VWSLRPFQSASDSSEIKAKPGMAAHVCNPSYLGGRYQETKVRGQPWGRGGEERASSPDSISTSGTSLSSQVRGRLRLVGSRFEASLGERLQGPISTIAGHGDVPLSSRLPQEAPMEDRSQTWPGQNSETLSPK
jgi:hypothetical protein